MLADAEEVKISAAKSVSSVKMSYTVAGVIPAGLHLLSHLNHKIQLAGSITDGTRFSMEQFKMVSQSCP
jgi:hypothetical protein